MKKKVLSVLFALFLLCACLPLGAASVSADEWERYQLVTENYVTNGTLHFCLCWDSNHCDWDDEYPAYWLFQYCEEDAVGEVVVPAEIEDIPVIGWYDFDDCASVTSITIFGDIIENSEVSFSGCTSLERVDIYSNVTEIDESWFWGVGSDRLHVYHNGELVMELTKDEPVEDEPIEDEPVEDEPVEDEPIVDEPVEDEPVEDEPVEDEPVEDEPIEDEPVEDESSEGDDMYWSDEPKKFELDFYGDEVVLTKVNVETVGKVVLPDGITRIEAGVFEGRDQITELVLPDSLTSIYDNVFKGCTALESVTLPAGLTFIGTWAFDGCTSLTDVYYGGSEADLENVWVDDYNEKLMGANWHYARAFAQPDGDAITDGAVAEKDEASAEKNADEDEDTDSDEGGNAVLWMIIAVVAVAAGGAAVFFLRKKKEQN